MKMMVRILCHGESIRHGHNLEVKCYFDAKVYRSTSVCRDMILFGANRHRIDSRSLKEIMVSMSKDMEFV